MNTAVIRRAWRRRQGAFAQSQPWWFGRLERSLRGLDHGVLLVHWPHGQVGQYGQDRESDQGLHAVLTLHSWQALRQILRHGDIGFAQAYRDGDLHSPDLAALLRVVLANRNALDPLIHGNPLAQLVNRWRHWRRRNNKANSAKNIPAHYDLGNDFYRLWLDETMNYSSAVFDGDFSQDMAQAQRRKVRRALQMADVREGHRVLEIGCGWGALVEAATREFGASVVGVTLSPAQLAHAQTRVAQEVSSGAADLRLQDYRDIADGPFDAVCSIEMIEAVGREYWSTYFQAIARNLKSGGRACVQAIVIADEHAERYWEGTDFIQQMIFPGGCLPSPKALRALAAEAGLEWVDGFAFGPDYAETLRRWRHDFDRQHEAVSGLGFDAAFMRTWRLYLAYCEAGFDDGCLDVVQYTWRKP